MIRITLLYLDDDYVTLRLDGKLVGPNLSTLVKEYLRYKNYKNKTVVLDFTGVSYIDTWGLQILESIYGKKLKIINSPIFIEKLLENIKTQEKERQN